MEIAQGPDDDDGLLERAYDKTVSAVSSLLGNAPATKSQPKRNFRVRWKTLFSVLILPTLHAFRTYWPAVLLMQFLSPTGFYSSKNDTI